jgi:hypothetical protein
MASQLLECCGVNMTLKEVLKQDDAGLNDSTDIFYIKQREGERRQKSRDSNTKL